MQRISITNPQNIIDGTAKKYYFKLRNTGGPKGDKGDKGDTGATGPQGPQGDPCTVVVNSTATLEPGSSAYVTNTGSLSNAVLDFGIPKGDRGPQGAKGDKGDTGAQGETGPRGPQGERGTNATVSIGTTYTLNPGSQATVYNSGSDSNAVLNFGIPKGEKGDTGSQGPQGPQGPTGPAGQNFAPTIVAELPATGDSSKLYLTPKAHTTQTATGNPITASVSEDAGQIESFQLDGDTFQQSYEGKNLFPSSVTWTVNRAFPVGSQGEWANWAGYYGFLDYIEVEPDTTYTFSNAENLKFIYGLQYYDSDKNWISGTNEANTFTTPSGCHYIRGAVLSSTEPTQCQLEKSASATSFEPYCGGTPSPNPNYPQPIQTVTGEQTVEIVGKNLFDKDKALDNYFYSSTGAKSTYSKAQFYNNKFVPTSNKITMSFSAAHDKQSGSNIEANVRIVQYDASGNFIARLMSRTNGYTFTLDANTESFILSIDNGPDAWFDGLQIEYGSTATAYAPYSKQALPLSLGSIELCKLGTYQDYIYKDGDSWKIHQNYLKITDLGSSDWIWDATVPRFSRNGAGLGIAGVATSDVWNAVSNKFIAGSFNQVYTNKTNGMAYSSSGFISVVDTSWTDVTTARASLSGGVIYCRRSVPTDTVITDTALIAQLEAIRTASLENGANTITNSTPAPNLAGDMEIGYYGYNPTNRYDKWLWLDLNNNYEQIGS